MYRIPIVMPQMGQSVAEGTVLDWKKKVGDAILADESVVEVETDKTTGEVESPAAGRLAECLKLAGEIAAAGETIGFIESETAPHEPHFVAREEEAVRVEASAGVSATGQELPEISRDRFSPAVMRMAMLNGLTLADLESIKGTGRSGRVTRNDVLACMARLPIGATSVAGLAGKPVDQVTPEDLAGFGRVTPMTSIRRTIADHVVQSIHTSAHVTMVHAVDMTHVVALRERIKDAFQKKYDTKMTYTAVMLFVTARVLREFPTINASVLGTNLILRKDIHIGCAVALSDESLGVPGVRHADRRGFPEIAQELGQLIARARSKQLTRADVEGGTFSISNFGVFGSIIGTPIINQPQVAILGIGAVEKAPVVIDDAIAIRSVAYLALTFDHRLIDGALADQFTGKVKAVLENWSEEL